jgi:hypothetical protein
MKETFPTLLDYLFDSDHNEDYAFAPHIKVRPSVDERYPNDVIFQAIDCNDEVLAMFACDSNRILEPITVEWEWA